MNNEFMKTVKRKHEEAEKRLAEIRRMIAEQQKAEVAATAEFDHWNFLIEKLPELTGNKPDAPSIDNSVINGEADTNHSNGSAKIRIRRNTLIMHLAELLAKAPNQEARSVEIAERLREQNMVQSANYRNVVYTSLTRRSDLFERTSPGVFRLVGDFEIEE